MGIVEYILDGLEAALELERELGTGSIEIDRELLKVAKPAAAALRPAPPAPAARPATPVNQPPPPPPPPPPRAASRLYDFVFLHDKPLGVKGHELFEGIVKAMGKTLETAPLVVASPVPPAKVYVVLGARALRKWFPDKKASPGQWIKTQLGRDALVTYSPDHVLRFEHAIDAVKKLKLEMWTSLKGVLQRAALSS